MKTLGVYLAELLEDYGVDTIFGIPGVHTVELYRGLPKTRIRHITPRHEQGAGFMAATYGRHTGKTGVFLATLGPGATNLIIALGIIYAPVFFRIARAAALAEGARAYVEAARALGHSEWAVLLRHVGPNVLPTVLLQCVILFPLALQIQAALGFLGLGVPPPTPDWGASLQESRNYLTAAPWLAIFPGLALLVAALAAMLLGRGLQARA
jgi:ABC-type phosphate transport system permease subunit